MLRIGRYVNAYRSIMAKFNKNQCDKEFNDILKSISDISNGLYFLLDHILLLNKLNFMKFDTSFIQKVDFYSNFAWGVECATNLVYDGVDYYKNSQTIKKCIGDLKKIDNSESEGKNKY